MILIIKLVQKFYILNFFLLFNISSNENESSKISKISLTESYVSQNSQTKEKTKKSTNSFSKKINYTNNNTQTKKLFLTLIIGFVVIGSVVYFFKSK